MAGIQWMGEKRRRRRRRRRRKRVGMSGTLKELEATVHWMGEGQKWMGPSGKIISQTPVVWMRRGIFRG
jgi:hypothetical protein